VESPVVAAQAPYTFAATRAEDGTITFTGNVPAAATQRFLETRGGSGAVDETTVVLDAPPEFARHLLEAMDLLTLIDTGTVSFDGQNWSASGQGGEAYSEAAVAEALGGNAADWSVSLAAPAVARPPAQLPVSAPDAVVAEDPPAPPEAAPVDSDAGQEEASPPAGGPAKGAATPAPSAPPAAEPPSPSDIASCQAELKALSDHNAILFQSGAAVITTSAQSELDAFAAVLQRCPDTDIYVEGHTDSDGDARANLALSVSRAEAVVNALAERGVASSRLYAVGYGESQPVADNTTAAGKAKNRRIVISVADSKGE
jgi:outer membrane protein OmpA-like peptidoglycan-associated protein